MPSLRTVSALLQGLFYLLAGRAHFTSPDFYLKIMPPGLPYPRELVWLSGAAEVILGLGLLIPATRQVAAWGVIALLLAVFPANIYHLTSGGAGTGVPIWALWLRLPLQALLIAWAYLHTRP